MSVHRSKTLRANLHQSSHIHDLSVAGTAKAHVWGVLLWFVFKNNRVLQSACFVLQKAYDDYYSMRRFVSAEEYSQTAILDESRHSSRRNHIRIRYFMKISWSFYVLLVFFTECLTITGTKAKMLIVAHILDKLLKMDVDDALTFVLNSTLLHDAARDVGM